jgi:hypothetical protein
VRCSCHPGSLAAALCQPLPLRWRRCQPRGCRHCGSPVYDAPCTRRLHSVALVCKRFCKLCSAPKLLRQLEVSIGGPNAVPRAEAVLAWLARHMPHVRSLSLDFSKPDDVVALHQLQAILMGCLSISSAAGQLGELAVRGNLLPTTGSWLLLMRSLRSLSIVSLAPVVIPSMFTLTRLESLELEGNPLKYSPVCRPACLRRSRSFALRATSKSPL